MTLTDRQATGNGEDEPVVATLPRLVIAGTHSGCGKTTVASGIMAALTARGMQVQPFKVGPDFIDPTHHSRTCGRVSRNLDPFMMGEDGVMQTFARACRGADIAVIEGVMGLFDGLEGTGCSSTAHVARILRSPVILVIDAAGMSRSIHALIGGYRSYDPGLDLAGIIVNHVGGPRHRAMIESAGTAPFVGWIPKRDDLQVKSRHLGLAMAHETPAMGQFGDIVRSHCDLDAITGIARDAPALVLPQDSPPEKTGVHPRIGVALDIAFCFYYQDNLDLLTRLGAELVFFSPISDRLPAVDGLYLGGGYPELHLGALSESPCRTDIRHAALEGMPVYGECGGLIYLAREITYGGTFPLCGILPAVAEMTGKIRALGYVKGETGPGSKVFPAGIPLRGHEFHYSKVIPDRDARFGMRLTRGEGIDKGNDGLVSGNATGTYTHVYFSPDFARHFLLCCSRFSGALD